WHGLFRPSPSGGLFAETPVIRFLRGRPGTFRVAGEGPMLFPNSNVFAGVEDIRTHDPVERLDYTRFLDATCGSPASDYFKWLRKLDAPVLDFLNVRYVVTMPRGAAPGPRWRQVYAGTDASVFENTRVLPRAFAPARIRLVEPPPARLAPVFDAD